MNIDLSTVMLFGGVLLAIIGSIRMYQNGIQIWRHRQARFEESVMKKINRTAPHPEYILSREILSQRIFQVVLDVIILGCGLILIAQGLL